MQSFPGDRNVRPARCLFGVRAGFLAATCLIWAGLSVKPAHAQIDIAPAATKTCDVMSGKRTADKQTLQYLMLLDEDAADANPVATALHREVVKQCPKAYLSYEQRRKVNNPFPAGSLVKQTPTQLTTPASQSPPDYALRCRGAQGMASSKGGTLVVDFRRSDHPADHALKPGQCSWIDRPLNANEPTRIVDQRPTAEKALDAAAHLNAGDTWTFWVVNAGNFFRVTASGQGTPTQKP